MFSGTPSSIAPLLLVALGLGALADVAAQVPIRAAAEARSDDAPGVEVFGDRICLKLPDDAEVLARDGCLIGSTDQALAQALANCRVEPLVRDVPRETLDEWFRAAGAVHPPGRRPGHMARWFRVRCDSAAHAREVLADLGRCPTVQHCYLEPIVRPAWPGGGTGPRPEPRAVAQGNDLPPPTPSFVHLQAQMFGPSPDGLGLRWAHGILGGRGQDVRIRMVEETWLIDHEDVSKLVAANFIGPVQQTQGGFSNHGLSGTSLVVADRNEYGITGSADQVDIKFVSQIGGGAANAILAAAADCRAGDVILAVLMVRIGQLGVDDWMPAEYFQGEFDAVLTATSMGRIVVASAANGSRSLDDPRLLRRFDRSFRDSGAIFVGASDGVAAVRAGYCNFGSAVDCNSWGNDVTECGYGTLFLGNNDPRQAYTERGTGTSAATPVICGAVASIQGAMRRQLGRTLTPTQMRDLLRQHGTAVVGSIGPRTDLRALMTAVGAFDGLELSAPDTLVGGSVQITVSGSGAGAMLVASLGTGDADLGFDRHVHLDLGAAAVLGFQPLVSGSASWTFAVPTNSALRGVDLYLQAALLDAGGGVHVTNSGQLSIL